MKEKRKIRLLAKIMVLLFLMSPLTMVMSEPAPVVKEWTIIKRLNVAPWLGKLKDGKDLAQKYKAHKSEFPGFFQNDLKQSYNLDITVEEAYQIADLMEEQLNAGRAERKMVPYGTRFFSMGWKKGKEIRRTPNVVLEIGEIKRQKGKEVYGYFVTVDYANFVIRYVFIEACGNLCLDEVKEELPPTSQAVPPLKKELPPPPPPAPPVQKCPEPTPCPPAAVYYYSTPGCACSVPYIRPSYSGGYAYSGGYYPSYSFSYPRHHEPIRYHRVPQVRPPTVQTRPPAVRPPTVRTVPPAVRPPGARTR